eukprot:TRINITY_DN986_c0_g2_i1.p1 TRINITY_DN986_c0_g2~~TRINITY_DN986_c0_g2_i1.p1  ORF type:complete len:161 (+),score=31.78 TRINITY_DN986_c0_g2_i1:20-502(+)
MYYQSGSVPTLEIDNDWYKPSHIENGLWLGDGTDSRNRNTLKMLEIRSIVKVMPFPPPEFVDDFKYLWIQEVDSTTTDMKQHFHRTNQFISKRLKKGGVLVHCGAGVSRSATIVIAYLMYHNQTRLRETLEFVQKKRFLVEPNSGFIQQLQQYENELFDT